MTRLLYIFPALFLTRSGNAFLHPSTLHTTNHAAKMRNMPSAVIFHSSGQSESEIEKSKKEGTWDPVYDDLDFGDDPNLLSLRLAKFENLTLNQQKYLNDNGLLNRKEHYAFAWRYDAFYQDLYERDRESFLYMEELKKGETIYDQDSSGCWEDFVKGTQEMLEDPNYSEELEDFEEKEDNGLLNSEEHYAFRWRQDDCYQDPYKRDRESLLNMKELKKEKGYDPDSSGCREGFVKGMQEMMQDPNYYEELFEELEEKEARELKEKELRQKNDRVWRLKGEHIIEEIDPYELLSED